MTATYTDDQIEVLEGIEAIRLRPGMYVGGTDMTALHHLVWEVVNNSLDEHLNGFGNHIIVTLHQDGSLTVQDEGRGIPIGIHPQTGKSTLETILTTPHSGGKFREGVYATSGGLHGVGITATNALSAWLEVTVVREGKRMWQRYEQGHKVKEKMQPSQGHMGTTITFLPDATIFDSITLHAETIRKQLEVFSCLTPTLTIDFRDEIHQQTDSFHHPQGLEDYLVKLCQGKSPLHSAWHIQGKREDLEADIVLRFTEGYTPHFVSFANLIVTPEGGTHETGVKAALTKTLNEMAKAQGWVKEPLTGDEWMEGLVAIISVKLPHPQFEGQTKNKLSNTLVRTQIQSLVSEQLPLLIGRDQAVLKKMAEKAVVARQAKEAAKKAKELVRNGKRKRGDFSHLLRGKLALCTGRDAKKNEIFIVEGDSAGGSAKQGRDRAYQSILPLRGKPLNVEKARLDKMLENEEIRTIVTALGCGIGKEFNLDKLSHYRVILMTDADVDGAHIRTLLLTFFFRYMRPLVEAGHLYIAQPPLYKITSARAVRYAYSDEEKNQIVARLKQVEVQRYKGLGEMNPEQLWETTMNPTTRQLIQVTIPNEGEAEAWFATLMGSNVEDRKAFVAHHLGSEGIQ